MGVKKRHIPSKSPQNHDMTNFVNGKMRFRSNTEGKVLSDLYFLSETVEATFDGDMH